MMIRVRIGDGFRAAWVRPEDVEHVSGVQLKTDLEDSPPVGTRVVMSDGSTIELDVSPDQVAVQLGWIEPNPRAKRDR